MKSYKKNPDLEFVAIPGVGTLEEGDIIVGDFDKLAPKFLVEVLPKHPGLTPEDRPVQTGPVQLTEPAPSGPGPEQSSEDEEPTDGSGKRVRGRPRKSPLLG